MFPSLRFVAIGQIMGRMLTKRIGGNAMQLDVYKRQEYVMAGGNEKVILCERGIRTFETATRNTLDLSAVPMLKKLTHLPVIVDPSHATGISWMVKPMALAATAAGATMLRGGAFKPRTSPYAFQGLKLEAVSYTHLDVYKRQR